MRGIKMARGPRVGRGKTRGVHVEAFYEVQSKQAGNLVREFAATASSIRKQVSSMLPPLMSLHIILPRERLGTSTNRAVEQCFLILARVLCSNMAIEVS